MTDAGSAPGRVGRAGDGALRLAGRLLLWACIALVFVRGLGAIASGSSHATPTTAKPVLSAVPVAEAGAFAVRFADAYLSFTPGQTSARREAVVGFLAHGLSDQTALPSHGQGVSVVQATVAREASLGDSRALVTVAAVLSNGQVRYLAVPVAADAHGGLDVFALPAFVAPPAAGTAPAASTTALPAADAPIVADLAHGFLTAYVGGGQGTELAAWLAPGTMLAALPPGLTLQSLDALGVIARDGPTMTLQATAQVRDGASRVVYPAAYRLALAQTPQGWRVAGVAGGPR